MLKKIVHTDSAKTTIIIRLMVGAVFLSEGIQKFLFPDKLGSGRFAKIGQPNPDFLGSFVGFFEVICGSFIMVGLLTRLASIPLVIIMLVAISTTKTEVLVKDGFWEMMHGSRTDWAMFLGIIIKGGGSWSFDNSLWQQNRTKNH